MEGLYKKVELLSNICIVVVALLLGFVLTKQFIIGPSNSRSLPEPISAGSKMDLPGIAWGENKQTLLLALAQGCHFCSESAGFYKQLVEKTTGKNTTKLIAIFPQDVSEGRKYLNDLGVSIADVKQVALNSIRVRGTPTLILVNDKGIVKNVWIGKMSSDMESEVLSKIQCDTCGS